MPPSNKHWKFENEDITTLKRWDQQCRHNLANVKNKIPELDTNKKLTVIDIGGNTGTFVEMLIEDTPYSFDRIVMFEPVPLYARWASLKFCRLSEDPKVEVLEFALSDEENTHKIAINKHSERDFNLGWNTMVEKWQEEESSNIIPIQSYVFDDIYDSLNIEKIDLIKIDVEGYETKVLKGMTKTLERLGNKPPIIIEIANGSRHHDIGALEVELSKLKKIGYAFDDKSNWPSRTFDLLMN